MTSYTEIIVGSTHSLDENRKNFLHNKTNILSTSVFFQMKYVGNRYKKKTVLRLLYKYHTVFKILYKNTLPDI